MSYRRILTVSLGANLALVVVSGYLVFKPHPVPGPVTIVTNAPTQHAASAPVAKRALTEVAVRFPAFHWSALESSDYKKYIANLRAVGCPEETIRDLIIAEINKLYAPKFAALRPSPTPSAFPYAGDPQVIDRSEKLRALKQERREILRELLGGDFYDELENVYGESDHRDWMLSFLPDDKRRTIKAIMEKYQQMEQHVYWKASGFWSPDDGIELQRLKQQRREELKRLLSSEELEQYDLRTSDLANQLRSRLTLFEPTEEEFSKIYRLHAAFRSPDSSLSPGPGNVPISKQEGERLEQELRAAFAERRYEEFKLSQEPAFQDIGKFAKRFDLSQEATAQMYGMKQQVEAEQRRLIASAELTAEQRAAALRAMSRETEQALQGLIGPKLFDAYKRGGNTAWIYPKAK